MLRKLLNLPGKLNRLRFLEARLEALSASIEHEERAEDQPLRNLRAGLKHLSERIDFIESVLNVPPRMKIIVYTPPFDRRAGGSIVLHKLCRLLREAGADSYIWMDDPGGNNNYGNPIANDVIDPQKCAVVYPEIVFGNPLNGKKVVRWLLNKPGAFGLPFTFTANDILVSYCDHFADKHQPCETLTVTELFLDIFYSQPGPRKGVCYTVRKGAHKAPVPETAGQFEITRNYDLDSLADIFRSHEVFYSYDSATFLSLQAALCGCVSVVVPDEGLPKEEWRKSLPLMKYGVAYGTNDIGHAKETMHLLPGYLRSVDDMSLKQVKRLIERLACPI